MKYFFSLLLFFMAVNDSCAQPDHYAGTWNITETFVPGMGIMKMELQISVSEKYILYPATLKIESDSFSGSYEFLMVRKNSRELAISKNKFARFESPFLHKSNTYLLNGLFDHSKNLKGIPTLTLEAIRDAPPLNIPFAANDTARKIMTALVKYFDKGPIVFTKSSNIPWMGEYRNRLLIPSQSPIYFSLLDTIPLTQRSGIFAITSDKKNSVDIVSVGLNGRIISDQMLISRKKKSEEILLDTGMNIIALFADNFGNGLPNRSAFNFSFGGQKIPFSFCTKEDSAAGFIVAKMYCSNEKFNETFFQGHGPEGYDPLQNNEKLITSLATHSKQILLAVWDDAVEDGDSVSISVEGKWVVQGFPVKKKPQFIPVTLQPGRNTILFVGDNLGSIPPNTSVLEIIDGKKRKSFMIETTVGEKNLLRIFYDH